MRKIETKPISQQGAVTVLSLRTVKTESLLHICVHILYYLCKVMTVDVQTGLSYFFDYEKYLFPNNRPLC